MIVRYLYHQMSTLFIRIFLGFVLSFVLSFVIFSKPYHQDLNYNFLFKKSKHNTTSNNHTRRRISECFHLTNMLLLKAFDSLFCLLQGWFCLSKGNCALSSKLFSSLFLDISFCLLFVSFCLLLLSNTWLVRDLFNQNFCLLSLFFYLNYFYF